MADLSHQSITFKQNCFIIDCDVLVRVTTPDILIGLHTPMSNTEVCATSSKPIHPILYILIQSYCVASKIFCIFISSYFRLTLLIH